MKGLAPVHDAKRQKPGVEPGRLIPEPTGSSRSLRHLHTQSRRLP